MLKRIIQKIRNWKLARDIAKFEQWQRDVYIMDIKVRNWAVFNKMEVFVLARKYSAPFALALMGAFLSADGKNLEKILSTWPEYFEELYNHKKLLEK